MTLSMLRFVSGFHVSDGGAGLQCPEGFEGTSIGLEVLILVSALAKVGQVRL